MKNISSNKRSYVRLFCFAIAVFLVASYSPAASVSASIKHEIQIYINGVQMVSDVEPFIDANNRTQVPIRLIAEGLGSKVEWDGKLRVVTVIKGGKTMKLTIGKEDVLINGKVVKMDTKATIKNDRTMVPLRFIAENLDCNVEYVRVDDFLSKIIITTDDPDLPKVENITFKTKFEGDKVNYYMDFNTLEPEQVVEAKALLKNLIEDQSILNDMYTRIDKKVADWKRYDPSKKYQTYINGKKYEIDFGSSYVNPIISLIINQK